MPDIDKPIVITLTVKPLKGGKRPIIVSAAPQGEMPLILTGFFPERQPLIDDAWMRMLTRRPQVVKVAAGKVASAKKVAAPGEAPEEEAEMEPETVDAPAPAEKPDQLVRAQSALETLPAIEGDHDPAAQASLF